MIGIYKIISPSNKVYIGQSVNIRKRFNAYRYAKCKGQIKLYRSFIKYGVEKHIFEIIEECNIEELNKKERYYQDLYNAICPKNGLNCLLTATETKSKVFSKETREKMSISRTGKTQSKETREKVSKANKGKLFSKETREKLSIAAKGRIRTEEHLKNRCKIILDTNNGVFYFGLKDASKYSGINEHTLRAKLNNRFGPNNTSLRYV